MSVHRHSWVTCDRCNARCESPEGSRFDTKSARRQAKKDGWHTSLRSGRDLCPICWEGGARE